MARIAFRALYVLAITTIATVFFLGTLEHAGAPKASAAHVSR